MRRSLAQKGIILITEVGGSDARLARGPSRVGDAGQAVDHEGLADQQGHCAEQHRQLLQFVHQPQLHDQRGGASRGVGNPDQNHQCAGEPQRQAGGGHP